MFLIFTSSLSFLTGCNSSDSSSSSMDTYSSTTTASDPMKEVLRFDSTRYENEYCYFVSISDKNYEGEVIIPDYVWDSNYDKDVPVRGISNGGFYRSKITKITLPKHLTVIDNYAFLECKKLKEVVCGGELKTIKKEAFELCSELETISFPDSMITIEEHAFAHCKKLNVSHWSNQLKKIDDFAFSYCEKLETLALSKTIESIGDYAFDNSGLINITIENDHRLKKLSSCFVGCHSLKDVNIGTGLTEIEYDFHDCESLKTLALPEGLKTLVASFNGTTNLQNISIPSSIERIDNCFVNCSSLQYSVYNNCRYLGNTSNPYLVLASAVKSNESEDYDDIIHEITVHNDCKIILRSAFKDCRALYQVTLGDNIYSLEDYCFLNCHTLTLINLPDSIKEMGYGVFGNCYSLREISLPRYLTILKAGTFEYCISLRNITINNALNEIGQQAFINCFNLKSIDLKYVSVIKSSAFYGCCNLFEVKANNVSLVKGAESHGYAAYYAKHILSGTDESKISTDVTGVYHYYTDGSDKYLLSYTGGAVDVTVPATVNIVGLGCFYNYGSEVHTINIGTNVTTLTNYCFVTHNDALVTINYAGTKAEWQNITWLTNQNTHLDNSYFIERNKAPRIPTGVRLVCSDQTIQY